MKTSSLKRLFIFGVILLVVAIAGQAIIVEQNADREQCLGKTLVIKSDTLIVVGYDKYHEQFILDDGRQVSEKIIELFETDGN